MSIRVSSPSTECATTAVSPTRSMLRGPGRVAMCERTTPRSRSTTATRDSVSAVTSARLDGASTQRERRRDGGGEELRAVHLAPPDHGAERDERDPDRLALLRRHRHAEEAVGRAGRHAPSAATRTTGSTRRIPRSRSRAPSRTSRPSRSTGRSRPSRSRGSSLHSPIERIDRVDRTERSELTLGTVVPSADSRRWFPTSGRRATGRGRGRRPPRRSRAARGSAPSRARATRSPSRSAGRDA